jgi:SPP1 family phage portal protein
MLLEDILKQPLEDQVKILSVKQPLPEYEILKKQWNPKDHDVFDPVIRPDKKIKKPSGLKDKDGKEILVEATEKVNRIAIPFQRLIVNRAVGFLLGNPVKIKKYTNSEAQETLSKMVEKTLDDNKVIYFDRKIARTVMSQCQAAELWYMVEDPDFWKTRLDKGTSAKFKLRVKLLSPKEGDKLYPYFDEYGDMVAFSREYVTREGETQIVHFDTWTDKKVIKREKREDWTSTESVNIFDKIPVIYYSQEESEWEIVQAMIDRFEGKISSFGDTNDYFGSPMVKVSGKVLSLPGKSTSGKIIEMEQGGEADYMAWTHAPESEKLEFDILKEMIYTMTQTPNISFEQMKAVGSALSGFAIKLMFTDAHLKTENKIEMFGEMFQRRLNLIKHICGTVINVKLSSEVDNLYLEPIFTPYLPKNTKEEIDILSTARMGKPLISNETALENNPLVSEVAEEIERMNADSDAELERQQRELTGSY